MIQNNFLAIFWSTRFRHYFRDVRRTFCTNCIIMLTFIMTTPFALEGKLVRDHNVDSKHFWVSPLRAICTLHENLHSEKQADWRSVFKKIYYFDWYNIFRKSRRKNRIMGLQNLNFKSYGQVMLCLRNIKRLAKSEKNV